MRLDHVSIVCEDSTLLRRFFVEVAGLEDGPRPAFCVGGYWLYLEGRPVLHLIERPAAYQATAASQSAARIDHLALRIDDAGEWQALLERLHASGTPYQLVDARAQREQQLFVSLAPNIVVEFVGARHC